MLCFFWGLMPSSVAAAGGCGGVESGGVLHCSPSQHAACHFVSPTEKVFVRFLKSLLGEDMLNCHLQILTPSQKISICWDPIVCKFAQPTLFQESIKTITAQQFGQLIIGFSHVNRGSRHLALLKK